MLRYTIVDLYLPRLVRGKYASRFVSTGHYINSSNFDLAIHFNRFSEWTFNFKFEDPSECDPERVYKNAWSFTFLGITINWIEV